MTLTQGHGCGNDEQKFTCMHDKVKTTHSITTRPGIAYHLINFLCNSVENFYGNFFQNFLCAFSRSNTILAISQERLVQLTGKGSASFGYWYNSYVALTFDLTHDLDLEFFKVAFCNSSIPGKVGNCWELYDFKQQPLKDNTRHHIWDILLAATKQL